MKNQDIIEIIFRQLDLFNIREDKRGIGIIYRFFSGGFDKGFVNIYADDLKAHFSQGKGRPARPAAKVQYSPLPG